MPTFVPDSSELLMLGYIFDRPTTLHLYKSDTTPGSSTTTFTEADFVGYSEISISAGDWATVTTISNKAVIQTSGSKVFSCTGGESQVVYGFYITSDDDSDALLYCERFATSRTLTSGTDIAVTPKVSLSNDDS